MGSELPTICAITPTYGRASFLHQSLDFFLQDEYPDDRKEWIILDSSPSDSSINEIRRLAFMERIKQYPWITYLHLPDRENINPEYVEKYGEALNHIYGKKEDLLNAIAGINEKVKDEKSLHIKQQFDNVADPNMQRPTIGEKRNVACAMTKADIIIHRDDDDYYGPSYHRETVQQFIDNDLDFMRWGDFYVYNVPMNLFGSYEFNSQHGCYRVSKAGAPQYLSSEEILTSKLSGEIRKEGYGYGLLFSYKRDAWEKVGGFAPLRTEEDVLFVPAIAESGGNVAFPTGLTDKVCRVIHGNSTSSRIYHIYKPEEVPEVLWDAMGQFGDRNSELNSEILDMRQQLLNEREIVNSVPVATAYGAAPAPPTL